MKAGWEVKPLGEVCEIKPKKKQVYNNLIDDDLVSFAPMSELGIDEKYFYPSNSKKLGEVYKGYTYFQNNDVILAKITPCFENGKLGISNDLINGVGFGSSEFIPFRPNKNALLSEFLYYFLNQESFRNKGVSMMKGAVGHKRIQPKFYENELIPIPPLAEQQQIVAILDKAFAAIDQAKANIEQNIANAEELFQSKLNAIFSQKGEGWEEKTLGEVCENLDSKRIPITKNKRKSGNIPYYGASGIVDYVDDYLFDESLLLVSEDGANLLARTYPIAFSITGKSWVNNHAHVLRFENMTTQIFIEFYLNSIKLDDYISGMAQPKLNQKKLNSIKIRLPNTGEQKLIVNLVATLDKKISSINNAYEVELDNLEELKKSLLQKAFAGELT